jgi:dipeptide/tripeptide permease
MNPAVYAKAIAGTLVAAGLAFLSKHGLNLDPDFEVALVGLVTGLIVYLIPNRQKT